MFGTVTRHIFLESSSHVLDDALSEVSMFQGLFQTCANRRWVWHERINEQSPSNGQRSLSSLIHCSFECCHNFNLAKSKPIRHPSPFHIDHKSSTMKLSLLALAVLFFAHCCIGVESVSSKSSSKPRCDQVAFSSTFCTMTVHSPLPARRHTQAKLTRLRRQLVDEEISDNELQEEVDENVAEGESICIFDMGL